MREEDVMYYQRVLSGMAIRTEEVKNYARARQLKHRSKRRALEIALESDYEEEEGYGNLTNRHNFDGEVVIEGVSNNNGNDDNIILHNVMVLITLINSAGALGEDYTDISFSNVLTNITVW